MYLTIDQIEIVKWLSVVLYVAATEWRPHDRNQWRGMIGVVAGIVVYSDPAARQAAAELVQFLNENHIDAASKPSNGTAINMVDINIGIKP